MDHPGRPRGAQKTALSRTIQTRLSKSKSVVGPKPSCLYGGLCPVLGEERTSRSQAKRSVVAHSNLSPRATFALAAGCATSKRDILRPVVLKP